MALILPGEPISDIRGRIGATIFGSSTGGNTARSGPAGGPSKVQFKPGSYRVILLNADGSVTRYWGVNPFGSIIRRWSRGLARELRNPNIYTPIHRAAFDQWIRAKYGPHTSVTLTRRGWVVVHNVPAQQLGRTPFTYHARGALNGVVTGMNAYAHAALLCQIAGSTAAFRENPLPTWDVPIYPPWPGTPQELAAGGLTNPSLTIRRTTPGQPRTMVFAWQPTPLPQTLLIRIKATNPQLQPDIAPRYSFQTICTIGPNTASPVDIGPYYRETFPQLPFENEWIFWEARAMTSSFYLGRQDVGFSRIEDP